MLARPRSPDPDHDPVIYSTPLPSGAPAPLPLLNIDTALAVPARGPPSAASLALSLPSPALSPSSAGAAEKPADYVYYQRRPDTLSSEGRARATAAKVKLESYYKVALETAIDLNVRCVRPLSARALICPSCALLCPLYPPLLSPSRRAALRPCVPPRCITYPRTYATASPPARVPSSPTRPRASTRPHSGAELDKRAAALPDERREREARKHAKVQAQFLRLRRTKIGLADFRTVKVIGRGAFGEVRPALFVLLRACGAERGVVRGAFFRCAWCRRRIRGGCMR